MHVIYCMSIRPNTLNDLHLTSSVLFGLEKQHRNSFKKVSDYFSDFSRECHELEEEYLFWYIYLKAYIVINNVILTETQHIIY